MSAIVLVYYGVSFDYVYLFKTMLRYGIKIYLPLGLDNVVQDDDR